MTSPRRVDLFVAAVSNGFLHFQESLRQSIRCLPSSPIPIVSCADLPGTSLLAYVCNSNDPMKQNVLYLSDTNTGDVICSLKFQEAIQGVRLNNKFLVVIFKRSFTVYSLQSEPPLQPVSTQDMFFSKVGTDGLDKPHFYCPPVVLAKNAPIIAFPCDGAGRICILNLTELEENKTNTSAPRQCLHIFGTTSHSQDQHNKPVTGLAISADGKKLASVSDQGRTVFLSDISNLSAVNSTKFERGREAASVYSLILSEDASTIAITTSRGTIHVYTTKFISTKSSEIKPFGSQQVPLHFIKFGTASSSVATSPLPQIELITYDGTLRTYTFQYNKSPTSGQLWEAQPPIKLLQ